MSLAPTGRIEAMFTSPGSTLFIMMYGENSRLECTKCPTPRRPPQSHNLRSEISLRKRSDNNTKLFLPTRALDRSKRDRRRSLAPSMGETFFPHQRHGSSL